MNPKDKSPVTETIEAGHLDLDPIPHRSAHDEYELSPTQLGMLIHSSDNGYGTYIQQMLCSLKEDLNLTALEQAWQEIINRHAVFRTSFHIIGASPVQRVHPRIKPVITKEDWRSMTSGRQEMALTSYLAADRQRGLEQTEAPLIRIALFRMADEYYEMVWTSHHALMDGRSRRLVLKELFSLYDAYCEGRSLELPQPRPYSEYIDWLKGYDLLSAEAFWRNQLAGFVAPLFVDLGSGRASKNGDHTSHGTFETYLSQTATTELRQFAENTGVTLNTLVQGSWSILMSRYTGEKDIVFGATRACRRSTIPDAESMVGLFINTLPVRVRVSSDELVLPWLQNLRASQVAVRQFEHTPLSKIQEWSEVSPGTPLFESIVVFENYQLNQALGSENGKWKHRKFRLHEQTNYPLVLNAYGGKELLLKLEYDETRFDHSAIERMLGHLTTLLHGMVNTPQLRIRDLPLLKETERLQLLTVWQGSRNEFPKGLCIHELFERQAEKTPNAVALVFEEQRVTYREVNERANCLAHSLRNRGVGPEVLVGICLERSIEMVIGLIGILKAGAAYVPLDLAYPPDRLSFMLNDAGVRFLLTQEELLDRVRNCAVELIKLDSDWDEISQESKENLQSGVDGDNAAYVIYTSGSTGKPKGVLVTHHNVVRLFQTTEALFRFDEADVWTLFHSHAFDFSVWEIWGALLYGGRLVIVPYLLSRSPEDFYNVLCREKVTVLNQTPSAFRQLISAEAQSELEDQLHLRYVIFGGETLELQSLRPWFDRHSDSRPRLVNMYGITETTVHVTYRPLTVADLEQPGSPIGGPLGDLQVYILDQHQDLVPIDVPGEVYVGGAGVSRGYLNKPELTAERFVPDLFSQEPGKRLYRSGDLARYRANGDLEYLGRIDRQVKIRGFRIELGEIEAVLRQHHGVRDCIVLAYEDEPGDKRLVAYVIAGQQPAPSVGELRLYFQEKLPSHMVPSAFVMLDSFPLTPNGKVDHRALPPPDETRPELKEPFAKPRTPNERLLVKIWAEVLRTKLVGIHDNFFELGGDSILSLQIISRARQVGLRFTLNQLFEHQTVAALAAVAGTTHTIQADQDEITGPVPLTPIQRWFFEQEIPDLHHWNQALLLEPRETLNPAIVKRVFGQLLKHHDALRLRFVRNEGAWEQRVAPVEGAVPFEEIDLSSVGDLQQADAIEQKSAELQASLNLSSGPLIRVALFHLGDQHKDRLLIVINHLAVDGVSWRILLEDFQALYEQLSQGRENKLPPKTTSYKRWAELLLEVAQAPQVQQERDYWLAQSQQRVKQLPLDHQLGANTEASARVVKVSMTVEETQALLQEVPSVYNTEINDVLLTALAQALGDWIGAEQILIDLEGHGREEIAEGIDLSRTVGWFTSIFPVLLSRRLDQDEGEALRQIKEQLRTIPNRGLGYGLLRYASPTNAVARELQAAPKAEVSFNYLGQYDQTFSESALFTPATESIGPTFNPKAMRSHVLSVSGKVISSQLELKWTYSDNLHKRSTIEGMAASYIDALRSLIQHCQSVETGSFSPSDFPLARMDQERLNKLAADIEELDLSEEYSA